MGERERYEPGTFCWAVLGTVEPVAAKAFYLRLFGWEPVDRPMGPEGVHTMFRIDGREVCALYDQGPGGPGSGDQGPPAWLSYISVDDVEAATARARQAGAVGTPEPFDVDGAGRMTLVEDPTGAHVALWEPRATIGAEIVNVPGAMCLNQLNTSDPGRATQFYADVFGWRIESVGTDDQPYWGIFNGPGLNGGMMPLPPGAATPSHWLVYFATADIDGSTGLIGELGGRVLVDPMPVPGGRIAVALDPQGAAFALFEGRLDP